MLVIAPLTCTYHNRVFKLEYQPSGERVTCSPPATPQRLQNTKWPPGGLKMANGVWKGLGHSGQLSLNKFFDPSAPYMRKVDNGEGKE